jgi:hypothetical protein
MITERRKKQLRDAVHRWKVRNPAKCRADDLAWAIKNPVRMLVRQAKRRASRKAIPFEIKAADLEPFPTHCPVLGIELQYGPGRGRNLYGNPGAASIDRIRNKDGYIKGNVIIVSLRANLLKGQASLAELQRIARFYSEYVS